MEIIRREKKGRTVRYYVAEIKTIVDAEIELQDWLDNNTDLEWMVMGAEEVVQGLFVVECVNIS